MLPTESFAEVVAFLRLFDLNALAVTNATCSTLAVNASNSIRWEKFPGLHICIASTVALIHRHPDSPTNDDGSRRPPLETILTFPSEKDTIEFVTAAFPNCIFDHLTVSTNGTKRLLDAIGRVADSVVVRGVLGSPEPIRAASHDFFDIASKFRKVNGLHLSGELTDDEANEIANVCRRSGIQEVWYRRTGGDGEWQKLAIS